MQKLLIALALGSTLQAMQPHNSQLLIVAKTYSY